MQEPKITSLLPLSDVPISILMCGDTTAIKLGLCLARSSIKWFLRHYQISPFIMAEHHPTEIQLHQASKVLEVAFDDGARFKMPCEYLRVHSPSAEVRAHTGTIKNLVTGKENVNITEIKQIGLYAIKIFFDDGHNSGLYDWDMLYALGRDYHANWATYQERCANEKNNT